jgi:hypothetical protein
MLSPASLPFHHSAFVFDEPFQSTVELDKHLSASSLDELDLDDRKVGEVA